MRKYRWPSIIFLIFILHHSVQSTPRDELIKTEERTFDFNAGGRIQVLGDAGFIRVEAWDKNEVYLRYTKRVWDSSRRDAEKRMEDLQIEISDQPGQLSIRQVPGFEEHNFRFFDLFDPDRWSHSSHAARIDFELKVPRQCQLLLESDEGDITVRQIEGEVSVDSDEGNIDLENLAGGEISAATDEGEINCRHFQLTDHRLQLSGDEGTVHASDIVARSVWAETDEGDIVLLRINAGGGKLNSDEGDIDLEASRFDEGSWNISTDEGDVALMIPANADAEITLESDDGNIRSDFTLSRLSNDDNRERRSGRLGEGRARLEIYTDEGDIGLRRR
ncbi:MAG: hypothetical protein ALAOOOJD_03700 [bacterium]|nr:hypothetical protein [bacterium]